MSDPEALVNELAELLGLYHGVGVQPVPVQTVEESKFKRLNELHVIMETVDMDSAMYHSRLAAGYLPSLVRLGISLLDDHAQDLALFVLSMEAGLGSLIHLLRFAKHYGCRFVREHPVESRQLFDALARCIGAYGRISAAEFSKAVAFPALLSSAVECLYTFMGASAASFASPDLSLDATTREGVRVTVRRLKAAGETVPEVLENLTTQSTPIDLAESRAHTLASGRSNWCYWDCETRLWDQHASACAKLPPGKEMAVCARCLTVRYCSRAHQKDNWKDHKLLCFKPTW